MAHWSLDDLSIATPLPLNGATYGHEFSVVFRLRYTVTATLSGAFRRTPVALQNETPRLEWNETITMKETSPVPAAPQFWRFETDMYRHNPGSPSIAAWRKRYVMAYRHIAHQPAPARVNGSVKIWSSSNRILTIADLGGPQNDEPGQALAVRNYVAQNGCIMVITLTDTPAISRTTTGRKERLVEFDIGVQGGGRRVRAYQYVNLNSGLAEGAWTRDFGQHASPIRLEPGPLDVRVQPPIQVSTIRVTHPFAGAGEYD
jgi:hypothetical protein